MVNDMKQTVIDLLNKLKTIDYISPETIPNIELYMDQVTSFFDGQLAGAKRKDDDKLLTKTMINNYTKNDLLPPPVKKKYSKEHMLSLIFIYYLKNIVSINDIHSILKPITEKYFGKKDGLNFEDIYAEIFRMEKEESTKVLKEFTKKYNIAQTTFTDFPEEDQEMLQSFSYICLLSFDIYMKKQLIEKIVDDVFSENKTESNEQPQETEEENEEI